MPLFSEAYYVGYWAALKYPEIYNTGVAPEVVPGNPYPEGTEEHQDYITGFQQSVS